MKPTPPPIVFQKPAQTSKKQEKIDSGLNGGNQCPRPYTKRYIQAKRDGETFIITDSQVKNKYYHADAFGIEEPSNWKDATPRQVELLQKEIKSHIEDETNRRIEGTYGLRRDKSWERTMLLKRCIFTMKKHM